MALLRALNLSLEFAVWSRELLLVLEEKWYVLGLMGSVRNIRGWP